MPFLFCNIGWMEHYRGLNGCDDSIQGGGADHAHAHEVCNFLPCDDGRVYGHVETIHGETDRQIHIEHLWGDQAGPDQNDNYADGVTVVWMATDPREGGRRVVGWYNNARVWRERQPFQQRPSQQHERDNIDSYRISASGDDATLLPTGSRHLRVGVQGNPGWPGQAACWFPNPANAAVAEFLRHVEHLIGGGFDLENDVAQIRVDPSLTRTEKECLIQARIGQGPFRQRLVDRWGSCAVTGCAVPGLLRASHIKPWAKSNNTERLDPNNGLLLIANLDAAFDDGLISFSNDGGILISSKLTKDTQHIIGITDKTVLRKRPTPAQRRYLGWHRENWFSDGR